MRFATQLAVSLTSFIFLATWKATALAGDSIDVKMYDPTRTRMIWKTALSLF